ncbi:NAD(P)H-dependent oxidoreductase [Natronolimnohabitans sp. A-GB9]|uniref:NAD(P)H-dependent oxidoreductase n=1 Tax=Natronolimnohabitans sp. A-GB9 TaxID=3069757 RepID=UPI0027B1DEC4|nr:NAD(P)H-dependent oxidoreductase [Natronolimnohabitans sp. A-GB9]MDQ2050921.1 NAD(P)H-dependent oxidoreductase [Natronolimnohabitans sp. A-GB9]
MNVLVILGHPRTDSYCGALAAAYADGARETGVDVRELAVGDCEFDPDVHTACPSDQPLESDLQAAQADIEWADHLVFVYPNWWATMPAVLKGFFDRVFEPGFAFVEYEEGEGAGHEGLLDGKTAELIVTMDMPPWVYRWIYRQPGTNAVKRGTLGYVGVRTTNVTTLGPIEDSSFERRQEWLADVRDLGRRLETGPESTRQRVTHKVTAWLGALRLQFYPMAWLAYTIPPLKLSYRTLGELTVAWTHSIGAILVGFVAAGGSWQTPEPWLLGLPFLLAVVPSITLAGVPDVAADRNAGKRTIAVRFGVDTAARFAMATAVLAAVTGICWVLLDVVSNAYGPAIVLSIFHALGLGWLVRDRLVGANGPQRIDGLMVASLSYITWFALVPLLELL